MRRVFESCDAAARERGVAVVPSCAFEVVIVGEYLVDGHARAKQLQERLHRVAESADARLAVANRRIDRDSRK